MNGCTCDLYGADSCAFHKVTTPTDAGATLRPTNHFRDKIAEGTRGPESDPKGSAGRAKTRLLNFSVAAHVLLGEVMRQGGEKYGYFNWAEESMKASTYFEALQRHLFQWWSGEDEDPESGVHHLAHVMACAMVLIEQHFNGRLLDDRPEGLVPFADAAEYVAPRRARWDANRNTNSETAKPITLDDLKEAKLRMELEALKALHPAVPRPPLEATDYWVDHAGVRHVERRAKWFTDRRSLPAGLNDAVPFASRRGDPSVDRGGRRRPWRRDV